MLRTLPRLAAALVVTGAALSTAQDARRHGADSPHRGLPTDPKVFAPYAAAGDDPRNELFRLLWLRACVPAEVAAVVPGEAAPGWVDGWVHQKRKGIDADRRWFGGDGRQLPLERLDDAERARLAELAGRTIAATSSAPLPPVLAVLFQHDLLRAAERLASIDDQDAAVAPLVAAARAVALDDACWSTLPDTLATALADESTATRLRPLLPPAFGGTDDGLREVLRRSTRLFDAERTLLWSRVFLGHPDGPDALAALLPTSDQDRSPVPALPIGFRAVLVQGIVALGRDGRPHATPVVVDVRTQRLGNRDPLGVDNTTFTHDGLDFTIWQLDREATRLDAPGRLLREVAADDQELFRDYGSLKHTTYRGQCALCHRLSDTPERELAGFPVLRRHAGARLAATGEERLQLAEQQAAKLFLRLLAAR